MVTAMPAPATVPPDVDTKAGLAWLRALVLAYVAAHPGAKEDAILAHVYDATPADYEGEDPSSRAVYLLAELVRAGALRWDEQRGAPDAPLRYWTTAPATAPVEEDDAEEPSAAPRWTKFAGNKGWLCDHPRLLPPGPLTGYGEPFVGSGGLFFGLGHTAPVKLLADTSTRIMLAYEGLRDRVDEVIAHLRALHREPADAEHFNAVRASLNDPRMIWSDNAGRVAAWVIYFLRRDVNGLWRENSQGKLNVSMGKTGSGKPARILYEDDLRACSARLQSADFITGDFAATIPWMLKRLPPRSLVALDPPYDGTFSGYSAGGFSGGAAPAGQLGLLDVPKRGTVPKRTDLERLADACAEIDRQGHLFLATNADTPAVRALFGRWNVQRVAVKRAFRPVKDGTTPDAVGELILRNYA